MCYNFAEENKLIATMQSIIVLINDFMLSDDGRELHTAWLKWISAGEQREVTCGSRSNK